MAYDQTTWGTLFPATIGNETRPTNAIENTLPFATNAFPRFISSDPVKYTLQNAFLNQLLSNDQRLYEADALIKTTYLPLIGGTVTGVINANAGVAGNLVGLASKATADSDGLAINTGYVKKSGGTMTGLLTLSGAPTDVLHAATKQYVDAMITGLSFKASVAAATTANITLSGLQTIDGYTTVAGDRVLVKDQPLAKNNGIYIAASGTWSRAADTDSGTELVGAYVRVVNGTANSDSGWVVTTKGTITIDTTDIVWKKFQSAAEITASGGIQRVGNDMSLTDTGIAEGTYDRVTVNEKGRVTAGSLLTASNGLKRTGNDIALDPDGASDGSVFQSLVAACIARVATAAGFSYSYAEKGYVKFPSWLGGIIIQWMKNNITATSATLTLPIALTTKGFAVISSDVGSGLHLVSSDFLSTTQVKVYINSSYQTTFYTIVIGK